MNILFDTSTLVAAMVEAHPAHARALRWLQRIKAQTDVGLISAHSVAELYAVLTTLPVEPRISSSLASRLIHENVLTTCQVVPLTREDYRIVIARLAERGLIGGVTYDALIVQVAAKANVDLIVTLNEKDFRRIDPGLANKISTP